MVIEDISFESVKILGKIENLESRNPSESEVIFNSTPLKPL